MKVGVGVPQGRVRSLMESLLLRLDREDHTLKGGEALDHLFNPEEVCNSLLDRLTRAASCVWCANQ